MNWIVFFNPVHGLQHEGSLGWSGSLTELDLDDKIGGTALVSTNPSPPGGQGPPNFCLSNPDSCYVLDIVDTDMKAPAINQDHSGTAWDTQSLSVGVARLLWLMNATVTDRPVKVPGNAKVPELKLGQPLPKGPLVPPGNILVGPGMVMESQSVWNYQQTMMGQFTSSGLSQLQNLCGYGIGATTIEPAIDNLRQGVFACSTFRVTGAGVNTISLVLKCMSTNGPAPLGFTLKVDKSSPYQIAGISRSTVVDNKY